MSRVVNRQSLNQRAIDDAKDMKTRVKTGQKWIIADLFIWGISYFMSIISNYSTINESVSRTVNYNTASISSAMRMAALLGSLASRIGLPMTR